MTEPSDDETRILPDDGSTDPLIGKMIGNYRVLHVLGKGGFGTVYKAEDTKIGRMVALKFLNREGEGFHTELFEREAKALGILNKHPNIVQIHAWDEFEGKNFFVLEYVESSVADLVEKYPDGMPVELAIRIIAECSDALAYAHDQKILHRDIKSPNILIESEDGPAKIADFGLARIHTVSSNTIEGNAIGSPAYMAPEQIRGQELTHLCDIYSLGVTLYELLCGTPPITGTTVLELMEKVRNNERVPLQDRRTGLPAQLYDIIDRATAPETADRYQSAQELADALRDLDINASSSAAPAAATATPKKSNAPFYVAVAMLLLLITAGAAYLYSKSTDTFSTSPEAQDEPIAPIDSSQPDPAEIQEATEPEPLEPENVVQPAIEEIDPPQEEPPPKQPEPVIAEEVPLTAKEVVTEAVKKESAELYEEGKDEVIDAAVNEGEKFIESVIDSIFDSGGGSKSGGGGKSQGKGKGGKGKGKKKK
jgi:serine/threonine protein kinase